MCTCVHKLVKYNLMKIYCMFKYKDEINKKKIKNKIRHAQFTRQRTTRTNKKKV